MVRVLSCHFLSTTRLYSAEAAKSKPEARQGFSSAPRILERGDYRPRAAPHSDLEQIAMSDLRSDRDLTDRRARTGATAAISGRGGVRTLRADLEATLGGRESPAADGGGKSGETTGDQG
jgi:hypothetical protein